MRKNKFGELLKDYLENYNISINEFADRVGTSSKNLIDIIKGDVELSQNMIYNISFVTGISVQYIENVEKKFFIDNKIDEFLLDNNLTIRKYLNMFNYKEASKKYDIKFTNEKSDYTILEDILKYLRFSDPKLIYKDNNHIFYKSNNNKKELLVLWLERCYKIISEEEINKYESKNIDVLVSYIRSEAKNNHFDKETLIKMFNKNGIYLAIEEDLSGSKIRGAFRVHNDKPAIYLTLKNKRIADIYFALLHELAHCKSDFNRAKNGSIISFEEEKKKEDYEVKADNTALNWMIPNDEYNLIKGNKKYNYSIMSFLVYRLALDKIIKYDSSMYQKNNIVI